MYTFVECLGGSGALGAAATSLGMSSIGSVGRDQEPEDWKTIRSTIVLGESPSTSHNDTQQILDYTAWCQPAFLVIATRNSADVYPYHFNSTVITFREHSMIPYQLTHVDLTKTGADFDRSWYLVFSQVPFGTRFRENPHTPWQTWLLSWVWSSLEGEPGPDIGKQFSNVLPGERFIVV